MALMRDKEKIQLKSEAFVFLLKLFLVPAKYNAILILLIKNIFHGWSYVQCRYLTDSKDVYFPAFLSLIYIYFIYSYSAVFIVTKVLGWVYDSCALFTLFGMKLLRRVSKLSPIFFWDARKASSVTA